MENLPAFLMIVDLFHFINEWIIKNPKSDLMRSPGLLRFRTLQLQIGAVGTDVHIDKDALLFRYLNVWIF